MAKYLCYSNEYLSSFRSRLMNPIVCSYAKNIPIQNNGKILRIATHNPLHQQITSTTENKAS